MISAIHPKSATIGTIATTSEKPGYRPEIDGLRAIAVIAVIINHLEKGMLPSGHLGVDIFFVISGFVITSSLVNHKSTNFKSFILGFYERRFKRLLPALIVFTILSGLLICLVNPDPGLSLRTGVAALFGFSNLYLLSQETNYFSSDADLNIFTHTWSLGVEEQFYLLFPLLVWVTGLTKDASRKKAFCFALILSALMVVSWIFFRNLSSSNQQAAFFLMPARFWELGSGSLCFLLWFYAPRTLMRKIHYPLPIFALILGSLLFEVKPWFSAYRLTTLIVVLTCLLLLNLRPDTFCRNMLSIRPLVLIGLMSYSLYLWHWAFTCLARWSVGISLSTIPLIIGLTIAASIISYQQIENKFRYQIPKQRPSKVLALGLATSSVAAGFLILLSGWLHSKLFLSVNNPQDRFDQVDGFSIYPNCNYYYGVRRFNPSSDLPRCTFEPNANRPVDQQKASPHIYFLGNSHASMLTGMIEELQEISNHKQTILITGAVMNPPLPKALMDPPYNTASWTDEGISTQKKIADYIFNHSQAGDIIVLGNSLGSFSINSDDPKEEAKKNQALNAWLQNLSAFLVDANKHHLNVIVINPIPQFKSFKASSVELCIPTWFRPNISEKCFASRERAEIKETLSHINNSLKVMQRDHKNLFLFDPFDIICPDTTCHNHNSEGRLYTDEAHLNNRGSRKLTPAFMTFLENHNLL
jgi:peptidoglycan/LPS O-acetylase OafA/YrhL